jgi:hypothetical protein
MAVAPSGLPTATCAAACASRSIGPEAGTPNLIMPNRPPS